MNTVEVNIYFNFVQPFYQEISSECRPGMMITIKTIGVCVVNGSYGNTHAHTHTKEIKNSVGDRKRALAA